MLKRIKQRIKRHHPLFIFSIAWNRFIPSGILRWRRFVIMKLLSPSDWPELSSTQDNASGAACSLTDDPETIAEVHTITGVDPEDVNSSTFVFAIRIGTEVVGGLYLQSTEFLERELGLKIALPEASYWLFSSGVKKEYRRQKLYSRLLKFVRDHEFIGQKDIYFAVDVWNRPSMQCHQLFSFETMGRLFAIRFLNFCALRGRLKETKKANVSWNIKEEPIRVDIGT